jgi:hypothetical protein
VHPLPGKSTGKAPSLLIVDLTHPAGVLSPEPELGQTSAGAMMPYSRIPTSCLGLCHG